MKALAAGVAGLVAGAVVTFVFMVVLAERAAERRAEHSASTAAAAAHEHEVMQRTEAAALGDPEPLAPLDAAPPAISPTSAAADERVGLLVYGAITDAAGAAVRAPMMGLWFVPDAGPARFVEVPADGTYSVAGLTAGTWVIGTGMTGYRPTRHELELEASRPVTRFDIVVEPAVRLVISAFTPDGQPLMEALHAGLGEYARSTLRVSALASEAPLMSLPAQFARGWSSFGIGDFTDRLEAYGNLAPVTAALPAGALGVLDVSAPLPIVVTLVLRNAILASQRVEPGRSEVVFRVAVEDVVDQLASVRIRFLDGITRTPLEGVSVELSDIQISSGPRSLSDAQGVARCDRLLPGGLRFEAGRDGYERLPAQVTVTAARETDLGDLLLFPSTSISGTVVDEEGHPVVARLRANALDDIGQLTPDIDALIWRTEADGTFTIDELGRRRYMLRVADEFKVSKPVLVNTLAGDATGVVLRSESGQNVSVRLAWPSSRELGLRVRDASDVVYTDWDRWRGDTVWTRRLPRGQYVAECYDLSGVLEQQAFEVVEAPVNIKLAP